MVVDIGLGIAVLWEMQRTVFFIVKKYREANYEKRAAKTTGIVPSGI
jgi:hypothetical protein